MKKEVLIVVLILALLLWLWSSKMNAQKPTQTQTEPQPEAEIYTVQPGDSIWKIAKRRLPQGSSNSLIYDYVVQISEDNGKNPALIDGILTPGVNDPDLIFPGEVLTINPYTPQ